VKTAGSRDTIKDMSRTKTLCLAHRRHPFVLQAAIDTCADSFQRGAAQSAVSG
jgi:hypothetical protein